MRDRRRESRDLGYRSESENAQLSAMAFEKERERERNDMSGLKRETEVNEKITQ